MTTLPYRMGTHGPLSEPGEKKVKRGENRVTLPAEASRRRAPDPSGRWLTGVLGERDLAAADAELRAFVCCARKGWLTRFAVDKRRESAIPSFACFGRFV